MSYSSATVYTVQSTGMGIKLAPALPKGLRSSGYTGIFHSTLVAGNREALAPRGTKPAARPMSR